VWMADGAVDRIRTGDLLITNQLLYQLSYNGIPGRERFGQRGAGLYSTAASSNSRCYIPWARCFVPGTRALSSTG
jgi:hypothetical protein